MDVETATALFEKGGFFVVNNPPAKLEFGIDMNMWETGNKFRGVKLIPPGLHLITYSSINKEGQPGMKNGFFQWFTEGQLSVRKWDAESEKLVIDENINSEMLERMKHGLRDLDRNLGAYPYTGAGDVYSRWRRLTSYIQPKTVQENLPERLEFSSATSSSYDAEEYRTAAEKYKKTMKASIDNTLDNTSIMNDDSNKGGDDIEIADIQPTMESEDVFRFNTIDLKRSFPENCTPETRSKYSRDKSWLLCAKLKESYNNGISETLSSSLGRQLVLPFIDVIQYQLMECPSDFFSDVLTAENFITEVLKMLVLNSNEAQDAEISQDIVKRLDKLRELLKSRFNWELPTYDELLEDEDNDEEFAPVVVEL
ncbi:Protein AAR2-like protein [Zancudomyces culisetae]|uniref:Protein AAR2-like protein n=1 Tax=Zancudomyces culisetae TaxID=1213189 RepID=A0A1R1PKP1_ZANCU|nr:Protein AAR2-like protein [Zancudomyces culisetae]|eukprot:OMH81548.1 Protein AAR2-like protein [Zancudomyces culisetae]